MATPAYFSLQQRGSSGPDVAMIQTWLNGARDNCSCYAHLTVDGKFGANVENAAREVQTKNNLTVDGKVGNDTWNMIYNKYAAAHGTTVPYPGLAARSGMSGAVVKYIQQQLNKKGYRLTADGKFGANTTSAVKSFQTLNGLSSDGVVGKNTWAKLA